MKKKRKEMRGKKSCCIMFNFTQVIIGRGTSSQMGRKENGVYLGEIRKKEKKLTTKRKKRKKKKQKEVRRSTMVQNSLMSQ